MLRLSDKVQGEGSTTEGLLFFAWEYKGNRMLWDDYKQPDSLFYMTMIVLKFLIFYIRI